MLPLILSLPLACADPPREFLDVEVEPESVPTVLRVLWTSEEPGVSRVRYTSLSDPEASPRFTATTVDSDTEHEVLVYGLVAGSEYRLTPELITESGSVYEGTGVEVEMAPPPEEIVANDLAGLTPMVDDRGGYLLTTVFGSGSSYVVIYDRQGGIVWWDAVREGGLSLTASLDRSGQGIVYLISDADQEEDHGEIVHVSLDGETRTTTRALLGHHDFVELPSGRMGWLALDTRESEVEGETLLVTGDRVLEADEGGSEAEESFNFFDDYGDPWPASPEFEEQVYGTGGQDWTHANSLVWREEDDSWLLMSRNLDALLCIDRATGAVRWQLGGERSDFQIVGEPWDHGHFSWYRDGRLMVFDNGFHRDPPMSRAVEYAVDEEARQATEVWSASLGEPPLFVPILGDVKPMEGDHHLVSWSTQGLITEVDGGGRPVWQIMTRLGYAFGRVQYLEEVDPGLR